MNDKEQGSWHELRRLASDDLMPSQSHYNAYRDRSVSYSASTLKYKLNMPSWSDVARWAGLRYAPREHAAFAASVDYTLDDVVVELHRLSPDGESMPSTRHWNQNSLGHFPSSHTIIRAIPIVHSWLELADVAGLTMQTKETARFRAVEAEICQALHASRDAVRQARDSSGLQACSVRQMDDGRVAMMLR